MTEQREPEDVARQPESDEPETAAPDTGNWRPVEHGSASEENEPTQTVPSAQGAPEEEPAAEEFPVDGEVHEPEEDAQEPEGSQAEPVSAAEDQPAAEEEPTPVVPADAEPTEVVAADAEPTEVVAADAEATEVVPADAEPTEVVPAEAEATEVVPADAEPAEVVPADAEPTEVVAADAEPTEVVPPGAESTEVITSGSADVEPTRVEPLPPAGDQGESAAGESAWAPGDEDHSAEAGEPSPFDETQPVTLSSDTRPHGESAAVAPMPIIGDGRNSAGTGPDTDDPTASIFRPPSPVSISPEPEPTSIEQLSDEERKLAAERSARREARVAALAATAPVEVAEPKPVIVHKRTNDKFWGSLGLFLLRIVVAGIFAIRGMNLLTDIPAAQEQFAQTIIPAPEIMAIVTGVACLLITLSLVLGLLTRLSGLSILLIAGGALVFVLWGPWSPFVLGQAGFVGELELLLAAVGVLFLFLGAGGWSLDRSFRAGRERNKAERAAAQG